MKEFNHVALNCKDIRAQEAFYARQFGFRLVARAFENTPQEMCMLGLGPMCLSLRVAREAGTNAPGGEQFVGFRHIAFGVSSLDAMILTLQADGIQVYGQKTVPVGRICFFKDPEGTLVELIEYQTNPFVSKEGA